MQQGEVFLIPRQTDDEPRHFSYPFDYQEEDHIAVIMALIKRKKKMIGHVRSNCNPEHGRVKYLEELQKHIPVDALGRCGPNGTFFALWNSAEGAFNELLVEYKFYFAAESMICPDYITEKPIRALAYGSVPVVYGPSSDYYHVLPAGSYIDVADFKSPKQLAEYLLLLDKNDALYARYFEFRRDWFVTPPLHNFRNLIVSMNLCEMCRRINDPNEPRKSWENIQKWFSDTICYPTDTFLKNVMQPQ